MIILIPALTVAAILLIMSVCIVNQGSVAVITMFGKYRRVMTAGLNFRIPFIEIIYSRISVQNRSAELQFQAVTQDQANVYFTTMLLYSVINQEEKTIINVAFKFIDQANFMQTLVRTVEGTIRSFVATKKQEEILSLRTEIVLEVKQHLDQTLENWGYHMIDIQLNDITFDEAITQSMAKVVASNNLKAAAENEGQALLITKTKAAEAEGNAIKIAAQAEKEATVLRGQGIARFREEVSKGMVSAAQEMAGANMDASVLLFSLWTEAVRNFAEGGKGNVIFLDGSPEGMQKTMREMMALNKVNNNKA